MRGLLKGEPMKTRYLRLANLILKSVTRDVLPEIQDRQTAAKSRLRLLYSRVKAARARQ